METKNYVAVVPVWQQSSSDYDAELGLATKIVPSTMTVQELMEWHGNLAGLVVGDLKLTIPSQAEAADASD